jgi:hypothetical protein
MKKYIVIILIPFLFSCGRADKEKAAALQAKNDSLVSQTVQKDAAITDFMKSVNDIEGVLDSIKTKENILNKSTQTSGELRVSDKNRIKSDITSIYALMLKDKQQLAALSGKLKSSGLKLDEFQKLVDHLQSDIKDKDSALASLRDKLSAMNIQINLANQKIDTLNNVVQNQGQKINSQSQTINDATVALNTGYYILGTSKELNKDNIIKGSKLLPDFNKNLFTRVDIRSTKEIPIPNNTKKIKLVTNHPPSSYRLNTQGKIVKSIVVTDEKAFWSTSKYLVLIED